MAQEFARAFYNSTAWKACRESYTKYRHGLCEVCLSKGIHTSSHIVHHKTWLTPENINNPEITLGFSNLLLVCNSCHEKIHEKTKKRYKFDENGDIVFRG